MKTFSILTILFVLLLSSHTVFTQCHFTWTAELEEAYHQTTSLRFQQAEAALFKVKASDPENLMRLHVENYLDFFKVYINEDEKEFERLENNKNKRLDEIEEHGDQSSPYYLYLQADIRLQWALARLKFEEYATAFFETNKAFKLLTENDKKFPDFLPNKKDLGILHAMVGTIPGNYKWAIEWFSSMKGTLEQGRGELTEVLKFAEQNDFIYEVEIYVYYAYLMLHLGNDGEEAWKIINTTNLNPDQNPVACFIKANVAMRSGRGDEAIAILENRPKGIEYHPFDYLEYMTGIAKLQRLDADADVYLKRFVNRFKGRNFIKDAYQKLAWSQLIIGDKAAYHTYMDLCKSKGYTVVGNDQSAKNDAASGDVPDINLLKARLLFDGGRYDQAFKLLSQKTEKEFVSTKNILEFKYRMGRIAHKLNMYQKALSFYQKTIDDGKDEPWYFACRAALERGHIYEALHEADKAVEAFELCQNISPSDHKSGLHQQAKAGLRRLKN